MQPRILFLDQTGALGGAELSLLDVARHFADGSAVVLFEDGPFRERLEAAGMAVDVLPAPPALRSVRRKGGVLADLRSLPAVGAMARRLAHRARAFDVVYANTQKALVVGALAGRLARRPVVWHLRDMLTASHFGRFHRSLAVHLANRWTRRVLANSRATAEAFIAAGGRPGAVHVVYNGIEAERFAAVGDDAVTALREALGLRGVPVVVLVGRLAPWKGQHVLLEALAALPRAHALLVGTPLFGEDAYASELRRRAAAPDLNGRIHFLGFRDDVPALLQLADVAVHTSTAPEPFGRVVVEAMLAGCPVLASQGGGVTEIIEDGVTGKLLPPDDPAALAGALADVLANPEAARRMATAAHEDALRRFGLDRLCREIELHVRAVLASSP